MTPDEMNKRWIDWRDNESFSDRPLDMIHAFEVAYEIAAELCFRLDRIAKALENIDRNGLNVYRSED